MQISVSGETPFRAIKNQVMIGPTESGYTLAYSVTKDGVYTANGDATPANENCIVNGIMPYSWLMLSGNTQSDVVVIL